MNGNLAGTGLTLSATGLLAGTVMDAASIEFTARAADAVGGLDDAMYTVVMAPAYICGDIDGDTVGPNIADLVYLVNYMFQSGPPPPAIEAANVDGIDDVNVSDLVHFVNFMFAEGPDLVCE